ncbi:hypothetical protein PISL3812_01283 [Talaromyces islandicus]|uniref:Required for respiratory growth protein 7, mitochondrial n=1 Tax=Talaromyces islandicus TaxID=28573 RepID=A0A0U1LLN3_TALIS|nr:hypothetical protein PISL3812_01283 [Talaromyces islandicus]
MLFRKSLHTSPTSFIRSFSSTRTCPQIRPFTRRLFNIPTAPSASSQNHCDLPSFLSYAERTALPETSTTYVGTHYEYTVLKSLRRFAFDLHRVGGRDDAGTDLVGTWHIPGRALLAPIRVVVQCKALSAKLGPNLVRELEGAFRHSPAGWRATDKLAILISPREATRGVRNTLTRSVYPLLWVMMERNGVIRQVLWNSKVEEMGFAALGVDMRYQPQTALASGEPALPEAVLTWDGSDLADMDHMENEMVRKEAEWLALWDSENLSDAEKSMLLDAVIAAFPDMEPVTALAYDKEAIATKRDEVLALLKERLPR